MHYARCAHCRKPGTNSTCSCREEESRLDRVVGENFEYEQSRIIDHLISRIQALEDRVAALEGYPSKED